MCYSRFHEPIKLSFFTSVKLLLNRFFFCTLACSAGVQAHECCCLPKRHVEKELGESKGGGGDCYFYSPQSSSVILSKSAKKKKTKKKRKLPPPPPPKKKKKTPVLLYLASLSRTVLKFTDPRFFREGQYIVMEENSVRNFMCGPEEAWPIISICSISKIQLVVYYHCCVLTG